jgi:hypothetical protein
MLVSIDFVHQGRRYRGEVRPVPGGGPEFSLGAWFVSMNGGPARRVFEAHREDADTPEFRHRLVIATWLTEGYNRRVSGERRRQGERDPSAPDRRKGLTLGT